MKRFAFAFLVALLVSAIWALAASPASAQYRGGFGPRFGRTVGSYGGYRTVNSFGYGYGFAPSFVYAQPLIVLPPPAPLTVLAPNYAPGYAPAASYEAPAPAVEAYAVPPAGYYATPLYGPGYETVIINGRTHYHYPHHHAGTGTPATAPAVKAPAAAKAGKK
jgi:hypothetical protein